MAIPLKPLPPPRLTGDPQADYSTLVLYLHEFWRVITANYINVEDIGPSVQPTADMLVVLSPLIPAADKLPYTTAADSAALADFTAFARTILDDANAAAVRTTLGLGVLAQLSTISTSYIEDDAVTYGKMQNATASGVVLGRQTAGAGVIEEILISSLGALTADHTALINLNSTNYTHLTAANHTDLTDGGATTLHKHAHTQLDSLAWTSSGHTGTATRIAAFDGAGAAAEYTLSGTGTAIALTTSPTFVTPVLGTPTSGDLVNCTNLLVAAITPITDGSSAGAGDLGEIQESTVAYAARVSAPASDTYFDITSLALTAGNWEISILANATLNGGTPTFVLAGLGTTTGNSAAGLASGDTSSEFYIPTATCNSGMSAGGIVKRISGNTTYYLKGYATYTVAATQFWGRVTAKRI